MANIPIHELQYHLVFCTKRRSPVLIGDISLECEAKIRKCANDLEVKILHLEVKPDVVKVTIACNTYIRVHEVVKKFKSSASELRDSYPQLRRIPSLWSSSYFAATIGNISESIVGMYIENQKGK